MPYSGTLLGSIPYDLTDSETPIYQPEIIEKYLIEHYENKADALNDIVRVLHDDKHQGNMMCVETKSTEGNYWYPAIPSDISDEDYEHYHNDSDDLGLDFQIAYEYKNFNIVKSTCKELGLTYKELGEKIGYKPDTINKAASTDKISEQLNKAIELYLKTVQQEKELQQFNTLKDTLKSILA